MAKNESVTLLFTANSKREEYFMEHIVPKCVDGIVCTLGVFLGDESVNRYRISAADYKKLLPLLDKIRPERFKKN